jgi:hypothetical protein
MTRARQFYLIVANTALLFWFAQLGAHVLISVDRALETPPRFADLSAPVQQNYAHMTAEDVDELIRATNAVRYRYAAVASFVHAPMASRFVNIDEHGIRSNGGPSRPLETFDDVIWLFGGSTTFGDDVADHESIPAQLERLLGRRVLNLGVRGDASLMENRLLNYYLRIGYRPALAVFLDGINEACRPDLFDKDLDVLVRQSQQGYVFTVGHPMVYAARQLRHRLWPPPDVPGPEALTFTCTEDGRAVPLRDIHARLLAERQTNCGLSEVPCVTFVQPFAAVHGRHDDQAFLASADARQLRRLFAYLEPSWREADATFVTNALDDHDRHAFNDEVHYSAEANRLIAEAMAHHLRSRWP